MIRSGKVGHGLSVSGFVERRLVEADAKRLETGRLRVTGRARQYYARVDAAAEQDTERHVAFQAALHRPGNQELQLLGELVLAAGERLVRNIGPPVLPAPQGAR